MAISTFYQLFSLFFARSHPTRKLDDSLERFKRRTVLKGAVASFLMLGLGRQNFLLTNNRREKILRPTLHLDDFAQQIGDRFYVMHGSHFLGVVNLDVATDRSRALRKPLQGMSECFSLSFQGAKHLEIPQGNYTFVNLKLGLFELFIVPAMPTEYEYRCIAIVNRI